MDREKREKIVREFERFIQEYCQDIGCTSYDIEVLKGAFALLAQPVTISRWVKLTGDFRHRAARLILCAGSVEVPGIYTGWSIPSARFYAMGAGV